MFPFGPESSRVEYKERLPQKEQLLKTICAFANQFGGLLVIGVSDQGDVLGLQEAEAAEMERSLDQYIVEHVYPPILPTIRTQWVEGKLTLVIEVGPGSQKPYYLRSKGMMEGTYLRFGASTHRAPPELISEMQWQARGRTWDLAPLHHASQEDLNQTQIEEFFTRLGVVGSSEDLLRSYEILVPEQGHWRPSVGGMLLFGRNPEAWAPEAVLLCSIFGSNSVKEGPIASKEIRGSLFVQLQEGLSFLKSNLTTFHTMEGVQRQDRLEVPLSVLREALVNALIHRNYAIPASTKLAIFDDRIEIFSPGGFPGIMTPTGLEPGISYIRNRLLARAFRESGLAEKLGTGLFRMREHCVEAGLSAPTLVEGSNWVRLVISRTQGHRQTIDLAMHPELNEVLQVLTQHSRMAVSEVAQQLGLSTTTARRRLQSLVGMQLAVQSGAGSSTRYSISQDH